MWMTIIILAVAGVVCLLVGLLIWLFSKHRKLKDDYEDLAEIVHGLNNDFRDFYTTALALDERMAATDEQILALAEKISNLQPVAEPANHPYSMAIQKVRSGASVSELMQTSGLSQDEAALLIRLHGSKAQ
ncbi:hypothetical protein MCAMS1_00398 [biofilm metagenome]